MPLWAWIGFVGLIAYFGFRVVRAARTGTEWYGPFDYPRATGPILFWFFASIDLLGLLFLLGFLLLIIRHQFF